MYSLKETRLLKEKARQINNLPPERWEEISWIKIQEIQKTWLRQYSNKWHKYPTGYRLILALEVAFPLTWLLLLLLQYNPAINTGRSFPTHLYQNEFACKTWVLFFFFLSESSKLLRVCFELWNWKRSQRERKRWKEGERVEKLEGVSRERMTERQKATVAQRDITWLFNNLPLSGAPTSVVSLEMLLSQQ